jgi:hypothetical protein
MPRAIAALLIAAAVDLRILRRGLVAGDEQQLQRALVLATTAARRVPLSARRARRTRRRRWWSARTASATPVSRSVVKSVSTLTQPRLGVVRRAAERQQRHAQLSASAAGVARSLTTAQRFWRALSIRPSMLPLMSRQMARSIGLAGRRHDRGTSGARREPGSRRRQRGTTGRGRRGALRREQRGEGEEQRKADHRTVSIGSGSRVRGRVGVGSRNRVRSVSGATAARGHDQHVLAVDLEQHLAVQRQHAAARSRLEAAHQREELGAAESRRGGRVRAAAAARCCRRSSDCRGGRTRGRRPAGPPSVSTTPSRRIEVAVARVGDRLLLLRPQVAALVDGGEAAARRHGAAGAGPPGTRQVSSRQSSRRLPSVARNAVYSPSTPKRVDSRRISSRSSRSRGSANGSRPPGRQRPAEVAALLAQFVDQERDLAARPQARHERVRGRRALHRQRELEVARTCGVPPRSTNCRSSFAAVLAEHDQLVADEQVRQRARQHFAQPRRRRRRGRVRGSASTG